MGEDAGPQHEVTYRHGRAPRWVGGVGGEAEPVAKIIANRARLLALAEQIRSALEADDGPASSATYRETDECCVELFVQRADRRRQMGEPREPDRPDYSRLI